MKHGDGDGDENEVYLYHSVTNIFRRHSIVAYFSLKKEVPESVAWGTGRIQVDFKPSNLQMKIDKDNWNKIKM